MQQESPLIQEGDEAVGTVLSPCRTYRYRLWRRWKPGPSVLWVMRNPSTADELLTLDPTVTRCRNFTRDWGAAVSEVVNLFAFRSAQPRELFAVPDPVGPCNDAAFYEAIENNALVMLAWGSHCGNRDRCQNVLALLRQRTRAIYCLGFTRSGQPRHPLYLAGNLTPLPFQRSGHD